MGKKNITGIAIISGVEMAIGWIVSLLSLSYLLIIVFSNDKNAHGNFIIFVMMFWLPFIFLLITGKLTSQLKSAGRILNLVMLCMFTLLSTIGFSGRMEILGPLYIFYPFEIFYDNVIAWLLLNLLSLFLIYFFTRKDIKSQFN